MDISGAYLRGNGWSRIFYNVPPVEDGSSEELWLLNNPVCGLVDSVRIWYLTSDDALRKHGLMRDAREYTLYTKQTEKVSRCSLSCESIIMYIQVLKKLCRTSKII